MSFSLNFLSSPLDRQVAIDVDEQQAQTYELMQFKYDGIWCSLSTIWDHADQDWGYVIHSRNGLEKENGNTIKLPGQTVIVGEYMYGSQWAQHPERLGKIYCYDLLCLTGKDLRQEAYKERYSKLKALLTVAPNPRLVFADSYSATNVPRVLEQLKKTRTHEGIILRNWDQPYSEPIGRFKLELEDDFVVLGLTEGAGRNTGRLGALIVGQYEGDTCFELMSVGGGFTDAQRQAIWASPTQYIGRVCRVVGKARFDSGAFRHPNFVTFREDKSPRECRRIKPLLSSTTE